MILTPTPADAAAFARFGTLVDKPESAGDRRMFSDWLPATDGLALQFHLNHVAPSALPSPLAQVERHPHSAQVFLPVDVARYLVVVMPSLADGAPDVLRACCLALPGTVGVIYRRDVWHAGIMVLDRPGSFAVLMWRGAQDDDVFLPIPVITLAPALAEDLRITRNGHTA
ncbi:MAG: ureidoglycolate lyase [Paracoccaceae bacterium]